MIPTTGIMTHPGTILKEIYMKDLGLTATELSDKLGWETLKVTQLIHGCIDVTPPMAEQLAETLDTSVGLWVNLQKNYNLTLDNK